jgi:hypothetical protein
MTVGPISQFWDISGWKFPRRLLTVLLLSWVILSLLLFLWHLLWGELKEKYLILYKIAGGKPSWFYVGIISWFVLAAYFFYLYAAKIMQRHLISRFKKRM